MAPYPRLSHGPVHLRDERQDGGDAVQQGRRNEARRSTPPRPCVPVSSRHFRPSTSQTSGVEGVKKRVRAPRTRGDPREGHQVGSRRMPLMRTFTVVWLPRVRFSSSAPRRWNANLIASSFESHRTFVVRAADGRPLAGPSNRSTTSKLCSAQRVAAGIAAMASRRPSPSYIEAGSNSTMSWSSLSRCSTFRSCFSSSSLTRSARNAATLGTLSSFEAVTSAPFGEYPALMAACFPFRSRRYSRQKRRCLGINLSCGRAMIVPFTLPSARGT